MVNAKQEVSGREDQFQELSPKLLERVFTSRTLCQRIRDLYQQFKNGEIPLEEQGFYVLKPKRDQIYVSPLFETHRDSHPFSFREYLKQPLNLFRLARIPDSPLIIVAHSHSPFLSSPRLTGKEPMIIPSAYVDPDKGDLYAFLRMRREKNFQGRVVKRPIQMIVVQGIRSEYPIEILFIQEKEKLLTVGDDEVVSRLKKVQRGFREVQNQQEIIRTLQKLGYNSYHTALLEARFTSQDIFPEADLENFRQFAY